MRAVSLPKDRMFQSPDDEARLVACACHGEPAARSAAFADLYRRYATRVYHYLFSYVHDPADAEDLTAQVFTAALESLPRYREQGDFTAWLFRIARNKANDYYRRRRHHLPLEQADLRPGDAEDPLSALEHSQALENLAALVDRLASDQVELLRLRYAADLSYEQIGALLGRNPAAVKMALHRLLRKLQLDWVQE